MMVGTIYSFGESRALGRTRPALDLINYGVTVMLRKAVGYLGAQAT